MFSGHQQLLCAGCVLGSGRFRSGFESFVGRVVGELLRAFGPETRQAARGVAADIAGGGWVLGGVNE